ncbi:unnamed protein product [Rotaria sp. Silwood1]|nr:unnamed protein product [Rotaria sp. Silwood1]
MVYNVAVGYRIENIVPDIVLGFVVDHVADDMHVYHVAACLPVIAHYFLAFVDLGNHRLYRLLLLILH